MVHWSLAWSELVSWWSDVCTAVKGWRREGGEWFVWQDSEGLGHQDWPVSSHSEVSAPVVSCVRELSLCFCVTSLSSVLIYCVSFRHRSSVVLWYTIITISVVSTFFAPYVLQGSIAPWFICWFRCYIHCLFVYLASLLTYSLLTTFSILSSLHIYFLTHLLPDLSTFSGIEPFRFQAGVVAGDQT